MDLTIGIAVKTIKILNEQCLKKYLVIFRPATPAFSLTAANSKGVIFNAIVSLSFSFGLVVGLPALLFGFGNTLVSVAGVDKIFSQLIF
jgi:hypothetical protein